MSEKEIQNNARVLIVDDEKPIRRYLTTSLSAHGYTITEADCGKEALRESISSHPDVIILDLGLPDIDGLEVLRKIRRTNTVPIIILSVREGEHDKISALDAGADDYLTKPFSEGELLARLRAVMRRLLPVKDEPVFKLGKLSVDLGKRIVMVNKDEIHLSPTEYDVLKLLVVNAGKVVTQKSILKQVWAKNVDYEGIDHLLRVTMSNLRNKLEPNPNQPIYIHTEPGIGYRLRLIDE